MFHIIAWGNKQTNLCAYVELLEKQTPAISCVVRRAGPDAAAGLSEQTMGMTTLKLGWEQSYLVYLLWLFLPTSMS